MTVIAGYLARMRVYFDEMFPLLPHALLAILVTAATEGVAARAQGATPRLLAWPMLAGAWTVFNVFLLMRLMDELKDRDIDRVLFPSRPLPSGRVLVSDIRLTLGLALGTYVAVGLAVGAARWSALVVILYLLLMFRLFFVPDLLRRSLPLSLLSHSPIVPLLLLHLAAIDVVERGIAPAFWRWLPLLAHVVATWAAIESWEIARKIRGPDQETDYVTYSRLLGSVGAAAVVILVQGAATIVALALDLAFRPAWLPCALLLAGFAVAAFGNLRFLLRPTPAHAVLRRYAEIFGACFLLAQAIAFGPGRLDL